MLRYIPGFLVFILLPLTLQAQVRLSGQVTDHKGHPIPRASVYLDNTLDGTTSDTAGHFSFSSSEKGRQYLVASAVGFQQAGIPLDLQGAAMENISLSLKASAQALEGVTVTAGAFEAGADKNKAVLTTLDIITTAGAQADVVRAMQTLPGTQQQGTQTGLFVRGGDASEAAMIIDGMTVQSAFFSGPPGVATRSRFMPFAFKGVSFSSGGYSARYGQALSSILELNTLDLPDKTTVNLGLNMAGVYASGAKLWKNTAVEGTASYNNLTPFYGLASTNVDYYDVPKGGSGSARFAWKPNKNGMFKVMVSGSQFSSGTETPNPDSAGQVIRYGIKNTYVYSNVSYRQILDKWNLYAAAAFNGDRNDITAGTLPMTQNDNRTQFRLEAKRYLAARFSVLLGGEFQHFSYDSKLDYSGSSYTQQFTESQSAGFLEVDWSPSRWIAIRPGIRAEYSALLNQTNFAPRIAIAIRAGVYGQFNISGGSFYQLPDVNYLLYGLRPNMQKAVHYIASYQWVKDDRTLRVEGYYKDYQSLLREHYNYYNPNPYRQVFDSATDNSGYGYAQGLELFWRDKKLIKNLDYWISYSYIDTRRLYKNFLAEATPEFISDHNASLIAKYYIQQWDMQINMTYSFATGRPYFNPDNPEFLGDRTPAYHNLSCTLNYLTHIKKWFTVVYAGVDNVTNRKNVFGYRYSADGTQRFPQYPALFRSYFVGVNFSLTEFNKDEL